MSNGDNSIKIWRVCGLLQDKTADEPLPVCRLLATLSGHTMGVYTIA